MTLKYQNLINTNNLIKHHLSDLQRIVEKIDGCKNDPENSSTTKLSEYIPSGFSMFTISSFRRIENKHDVHRGKDCMKKFCEFLREHPMKIINF